MNAVKSYEATVVVRPNDSHGSEGVAVINLRALNEHQARRLVINEVYGRDYLVSRFLLVKKLKV